VKLLDGNPKDELKPFLDQIKEWMVTKDVPSVESLRESLKRSAIDVTDDEIEEVRKRRRLKSVITD
jgi:hypothetical protein